MFTKTQRNNKMRLLAATAASYIDILDSNGRVLVSSQAATRNFVSTEIDAGLTYYVRVAAGDTMTSTVGYTLMGQEFE